MAFNLPGAMAGNDGDCGDPRRCQRFDHAIDQRATADLDQDFVGALGERRKPLALACREDNCMQWIHRRSASPRARPP